MMKKKKTRRAIPFDTDKTLEQLENSVWPHYQQDLAPIVDNAMRLIEHNIDAEGGKYMPVRAGIEHYWSAMHHD